MKKIIFYYGTVGSGKTELLIDMVSNYRIQNKKVLILNDNKDNRFGDSCMVTSRNGNKLSCINYDDETNLYKLISNNHKGKLHQLLIDEGQFLKDYQVKELPIIQDYFKCNIKIFGLKTDFQNNLFEGSKSLIEISDTLVEIPMKCEFCDNMASRNLKIDSSNKPIFKGSIIDIGGSEKYRSVCRKCYDHLYIQSKYIHFNK